MNLVIPKMGGTKKTGKRVIPPKPKAKPKPVKKKINARVKGATFERRVAKAFSELYGFEIARTPGSGAWNSSGDLTPKDPRDFEKWDLSIECKNNEGWNMKQIFEIRSEEDMPKVFLSWWNQCLKDAQKYDRKPLVVFTKNQHPDIVLFRKYDFPYRNTTVEIHAGPFILMDLESFLKCRREDPRGSKKCYSKKIEKAFLDGASGSKRRGKGDN